MSEHDVLCCNVNICTKKDYCHHKDPHRFQREECSGGYCGHAGKNWGECKPLWQKSQFATEVQHD